ncbi:MAG: hypothetical protein CMP11_07880, partial [Zetaproteobacteria bacterium]|nr:hypothetical protein [Pseudobdellovibrionaceae bacterium]
MRKIQVCVPSKVMIVGEYAVLEGEPCLSTCIPPALFVHLEDSNNEKYQIESKDWYENKSFDYFELQKVAQKYYFYKIFYNAIKEYQIGPVKMTIDSKIPSYAGFGSSSALRLGINLACSLFNKLSYAEKPTTKETWTAAKSAFLDQKFLQSNASGYDIITQLHGGVIVTSPLQEAWPGKINKLSVNENRVRNFLHIYLGGKGSQTKKVLNDTHQWLKDCG